MKNTAIHPWKVVEHKPAPSDASAFLGNGYMGLNGCFEETYTGDFRALTYVGKTASALRLDTMTIEIDGEELDLNRAETTRYERTLDLQTGLLQRRFTVQTAKGLVHVRVERFVSMAQKELLAVYGSITPEYDAHVVIKPSLAAHDGDFWEMRLEEETEDALALLLQTKEEPALVVSAAMSCWADGLEMHSRATDCGLVQSVYAGDVTANDTVSLEKYALCFTSGHYDEKVLTTMSLKAASRARELGYDELRDAHAAAWKARWSACGVSIDGDDEALLAIRKGMFALMCAYQGDDRRLAVEADASCLPVYLAQLDQETIRPLLLDGALYPDNAAVALAFYQYASYTGDYACLRREGLGILCAVARFFVENETRLTTWYQNRMAAWSTGLFVTQTQRASQERLDKLGVSRKELSGMTEAITRMNRPDTQQDSPADVLRCLYQLNHLYETEIIRRSFDVCHPLVEDCLLERCVLAAQLGEKETALQLFREACARGDNPAAPWLMLAQGFAGLRTSDGLSLNPILPDEWKGYAFLLRYRGRLLRVSVQPGEACVELLEGGAFPITLCGKETKLETRLTHAL